MRYARSLATLTLLLLAASCSDDSAGPGATGADSLHVSPSALRMWVGDTARVSAEVRGPDGSVREADLEWSSNTPAVQVSPTGLARAVARGEGTLRVSGDGLSADVPVVSLPVIRGQVHAPGGADLAGLRATWNMGAGADHADVGADGAFEIRASSIEPMGDLRIDAPPPRTFHPFLFPFHVDALSAVTVVMVPLAWTVQKGIFRGERVETSLDPALDDDADDLLFTYFFGQPHPRSDPTTYRLDLLAWPEEAVPARVAFDHRHGTPDATPEDSAAIWGILERMEEVIGLDLFEPAVADSAWWPRPPNEDPGFIPGVIRVVYDARTWGGLPLAEEMPRSWTRDLGEWADGGRFTTFQVDERWLSGGVLGVGALEPLRLADGPVPWETVLMHEMLHVLGLGHTCRLPSPMGPCLRTPEVSRFDVAYMELLREVLRLEREHDTFFGIMPAAIGERKVLLGLPALPNLTP